MVGNCHADVRAKAALEAASPCPVAAARGALWSLLQRMKCCAAPMQACKAQYAHEDYATMAGEVRCACCGMPAPLRLLRCA